MRILIILSIILSSFCLKANDTLITSVQSDTSFVFQKNADSMAVVKIVKGVVSVVPIFVNRPLFVRLLSQPEFTAIMTALILGLVRGVERSRMRRKTRNKE